MNLDVFIDIRRLGLEVGGCQNLRFKCCGDDRFVEAFAHDLDPIVASMMST